jgi:hypothetical protein
MKRTKQKTRPVLMRLTASSRRAERALTTALADVSASNKRLTRKRPKYTLAELIAQSPGGLYIDRDWDQAPPVGRELL